MSLRNLSEQLLHDIGRQIVHGEILPGQSLPKVETLSEMKGVSRTVVREVFRGLTARRLIESTTRIGTLVCPRTNWQWWDPDVLTWASESKDNREFLYRLTEVRLAIEPAAMELAANNASEQNIIHIQERFRMLEASLGDEEEWVKADYEFHYSLIVAANNELILSLVQTLRHALDKSRHTTYQSINDDEVLERHKSVMEAVCSRNGTMARQKMHELLTRVSQLMNASKR